MRFRRSLWLAAFIGALLLARQGVLLLEARSTAFRDYREGVESHQLEPAALFYTEIPLALWAEKEVRRRAGANSGR